MISSTLAELAAGGPFSSYLPWLIYGSVWRKIEPLLTATASGQEKKMEGKYAIGY